MKKLQIFLVTGSLLLLGASCLTGTPELPRETVIYGTDMSPASVEAARQDCAEQGGTFNQCGSACPEEADFCATVCALTCEFPE